MQAIRKRIGRNVKRLREARHWSQDDLAEAVGNSQKHIGQIERGEVNTRINTLAAIAYRLSVALTDLFLEPGEARRPRARTFTSEQYTQFEEAARVLESLRLATGRQRRGRGPR